MAKTVRECQTVQELFDLIRNGTDVLTATLMIERAYELGWRACREARE